MKRLRFVLVTIVQTLLRLLPFPHRTGLLTVGTPGRDAPVLLTGNFGLTVERVRRALAGIDAYLLVANSRGVNVWCAATGGHLTNHDVVSVLKTSGIDKLVDHREVILPQLAATGIEGRVVLEKTGWEVIWGPVYATSITRFLNSGYNKTVEMRTVNFHWPQRLEMAVAWAFPMSLLAFLVYPFWPGGVLPLVGLVWAWSLGLFLAFPLYQGNLRAEGRSRGFIFFSFGERGTLFFLWVVFVLCLTGYAALSGDFSWAMALRYSLGSLVVVLILGLDLTGSTPIYKSGLHKDRLLGIELDTQRCTGAGTCLQVCPVDVFEIDRERHLASLPRRQHCVQCGACIVQCPRDALYFRDPQAHIVTPDTVRRFKLNLLGDRKVVARGQGDTG